MLSNKQIFSNLIYPKEFSKEVIKTGHDITNIQIDHAFPVLVFLVVVACILFVVMVKYIIDNFFITSSSEEELLGVEGLVKFYKSLYKSDLDYWIKEEMYIRNNMVSFVLIINVIGV